MNSKIAVPACLRVSPDRRQIISAFDIAGGIGGFCRAGFDLEQIGWWEPPRVRLRRTLGAAGGLSDAQRVRTLTLAQARKARLHRSRTVNGRGSAGRLG